MVELTRAVNIFFRIDPFLSVMAMTVGETIIALVLSSRLLARQADPLLMIWPRALYWKWNSSAAAVIT